jgi:hypothetical protein
MKDPFTDPANANNKHAGPATQSNKDPGRMNSLENGILLCIQHHADYDNFRFAINPDVRTPLISYSISNFVLSRPANFFPFMLAVSNFMTLK